MKLDPKEVSFVNDEPAILLNNGSTVMPTTRVTEDTAKELGAVCSKDDSKEDDVE